MSRRRRGLSPEDRQLWEAVAATTVPLHPPGVAPAPEGAGPPAEAPAPAPPPRMARRQARPPEPPPITLDLAPDPQAALAAGHPRMDRRRFERLRRGRLEPEARIDLHGMTSERAHAALAGFIHEAHAASLRLVLVITGKGRADAEAMQPHRQGILRHSVPHWLGAPPLGSRILDVLPAHQRHGGAGAFYVYLRRLRG
ncbi:MAG TPA: Smr/MutS family protein [Amaricoccus sp.]|nr:Smr/MutS family protein [Amaricoccus sp.]